MKSRTLYFFALLCLGASAFSRTLEFDLNKGSCQKFRGHLYVFGFLNTKETAVVCIYKLDTTCRKTDSTQIELGRTGTENFLDLYSDTLHDFLNIYVQEKDKKSVSILRFNSAFERVAKIEAVDIARLNNSAMFENEVLFHKKEVYSIKIETDSTGKQFYLNKYLLKSDTGNFDYLFKWQFPFERKNVEWAHIFYANSRHVYLFVQRSGEAAAQWILQIESATGRMIKGTKLNDKTELNTYVFGTYHFHPVKRSVTVYGQKFTAAEWGPGKQVPDLNKQIMITAYLCEIDSSGDIVTKQEFKLPVLASAGAKKNSVGFILRMNSRQKSQEDRAEIETDIYRAQAPGCFNYVNTILLRFNKTEDKWLLQKNTISSNLSIEDQYTTMDKLDRNGKLCCELGCNFNGLFYGPLPFPAKIIFKTDADENPQWLLMKSESRKNTVHFMALKPVKKIYQLEKVAAVEKSARPLLFVFNNSSYLVAQQVGTEKYQLRLFYW